MTGGLKKKQIEQICEVLSRHPEVDKAILYGSRALKTNKPGSDIDLTLKGNNLDLKVLNRISAELDDLLLPYNIDLSLYNAINDPDLLDHINRVGIQLFRKEKEAGSKL